MRMNIYGEIPMKFRIGFVANSSASSFLVMDKTLDLDAVKKRFFDANISTDSACFHIIDEKFLFAPRNDHFVLPFLKYIFHDLDLEHNKKFNELIETKLECSDEYYLKKRRRFFNHYIETDVFNKYIGMFYFCDYVFNMEEELNERLSDIGCCIHIPEPSIHIRYLRLVLK